MISVVLICLTREIICLSPDKQQKSNLVTNILHKDNSESPDQHGGNMVTALVHFVHGDQLCPVWINDGGRPAYALQF